MKKAIKYLSFILFSGIMGFSMNTKPTSRVITAKKEIVITEKVTRILVSKERRKIYAYFADTFKVYRCALGRSPQGHKEKQGDNKTPEGNYFISMKKPNVKGLKALEISYPNAQDIAHATANGVSPGGGIQIHGLWYASQNPSTHWMYDWTFGCIAINNKEIMELYAWTPLNTPITIEAN